MTHRVDAGVDSMQTTGSNSSPGSRRSQSQIGELGEGHDPVLTPGK